MATRKGLIETVGARYRSASVSERTTILDEFAALTGYHRKHAIRVLGSAVIQDRAPPERNRVYDEAVRQALIVLWEAGDRVCGKRLKVLIPILISAMEHPGHRDLDALIKVKRCRSVSKTREGARMSKTYHAPATPYERLLTSPCVSEAIKAKLGEQFDTLLSPAM